MFVFCDVIVNVLLGLMNILFLYPKANFMRVGSRGVWYP